MSKQQKNKVITKGYDLQGNGIFRVMRLYFFARVIPVGNLSTGMGIRCVFILFMLHIFGPPLYYLNVRYGERLRAVKRFLKKG